MKELIVVEYSCQYCNETNEIKHNSKFYNMLATIRCKGCGKWNICSIDADKDGNIKVVPIGGGSK